MVVEGVEKSLLKRKWAYRAQNESLVTQILQHYDGISSTLAQILVARQIPVADVESYLNPTLQKNFPNPNILKAMPKAVERICQSIQKGEMIGIMGDYDVDGATSSAILKLFLNSIGIETQVYIPEREDGYGPNIKEMECFKKKGIRLIVTVDCGMTAFEAIEAGHKMGLDIIVLDHHEPEKTLPKAYTVVNPKCLDEDKDNPCFHMAACGVVFLTIVAINKYLREKGFYKKVPEPDLKQWLDLVAFGTVCDVVPLRGVNRLLVKTGLKYLNHTKNIGIQALREMAKLNDQIAAYQIGFILGPRINAGGRVGKSSLGLELLSSKNIEEAHVIASQLEELNMNRRSIEAQVLEEATQQAEKAVQENLPFLLVKGNKWHQGVVGIVAGRLKDKYQRPTFALSIDGDDVKGSSRSVMGIDLGMLVMSAMEKGILEHGGGHPMAAGFSLKKNKIDDFFNFLREKISTYERDIEAENTLFIDMPLDVSGATEDLLADIQKMEPFGEGNPEPCFVLRNVKVAKTIVTYNGHIICKLQGKGGTYLDAIMFRAAGTPAGDVLTQPQANKRYHMAGTLRLDNWNNRKKVQFFIQDLAVAS